MEHILELNNLCKNYDNFSLKNISLKLEKGTLNGFIGPNGAGKTTTIHSILNLVKPDNGSIKILGLDSVADEINIKSKVGAILDDGHFYEEMTMEKMTQLIAPMYNTWNKHDYQDYMSIFGLDKNKKIKDLSRGMRMKYSLAIGLSHNAELFIMDEPTAGLDPLIRRELIDIINDIVMTKNKTVLMSTHITSDLDKTVDYLYFIYDGNMILQGGKDDLKESHSIVKGSLSQLPAEYETYFVSIDKYKYGFEGLTDQKMQVKNLLSGQATYEMPSIEDLMLYYIRRYQQCIQT